MEGERKNSPWLVAAGSIPLLVAARDVNAGLAVATAFFAAHAVATTVALLLPRSFPPSRVAWLSVLAASLSVATVASIVRIADPLLFERIYDRMFMAAFCAPVLMASEPAPERDRGWERLAFGLGAAAAVFAFGAFREFLAVGTISLAGSASDTGISLLPMAAQPSGGLILVGLVAALGKTAAAFIKRSGP